MRSVVQRCASPDRMSRTNMALLMRVLLTASQVLTADSKITNAEANIVDLLAVDDFQAVATALVPTPWSQCLAQFFAVLVWCLCSGALAGDCLRLTAISGYIFLSLPVGYLSGLDRGVLWAVGLHLTPVARGFCDVVLGTVGGSALQVHRNGFPLLSLCVWALPCGPWRGLLWPPFELWGRECCIICQSAPGLHLSNFFD